jgi:hypothetical protein
VIITAGRLGGQLRWSQPRTRFSARTVQCSQAFRADVGRLAGSGGSPAPVPGPGGSPDAFLDKALAAAPSPHRRPCPPPLHAARGMVKDAAAFEAELIQVSRPAEQARREINIGHRQFGDVHTLQRRQNRHPGIEGPATIGRQTCTYMVIVHVHSHPSCLTCGMVHRLPARKLELAINSGKE